MTGIFSLDYYNTTFHITYFGIISAFKAWQTELGNALHFDHLGVVHHEAMQDPDQGPRKARRHRKKTRATTSRQMTNSPAVTSSIFSSVWKILWPDEYCPRTVQKSPQLTSKSYKAGLYYVACQYITVMHVHNMPMPIPLTCTCPARVEKRMLSDSLIDHKLRPWNFMKDKAGASLFMGHTVRTWLMG